MAEDRSHAGCLAGQPFACAAVWVIPPRPWLGGKRGETTPAADLAGRANLSLRAGEPASPSRQDKAMTALLTSEGTQAPSTEPASPASRGRIRKAFHRIHLTIEEMNYACRRIVELQAPWIVDDQRHRR